MRLGKQLESMIGNTYMYKLKNVTIKNYYFADNNVIIVTDTSEITIPSAETDTKLQEFLPISVSKVYHQTDINELPAAKNIRQEFPNIIKTLTESIEKIKTKPDYIKQAEAINRTVNTILNIAKTEISINKIKNS